MVVMTSQLLSLLTGATAVGAATVGGVFFAFSGFVMPALRRLRPAAGVAAMQQINITAVRAPLMLAVFGTAAGCLIVAIGTGLSGSRRTVPVGSAAALYLIGTVVETMAVQVPMNNRLAALDPEAPASAAVWHDYLRRWTAGNSVRTAAAIAAAGVLTWAVTLGED